MLSLPTDAQLKYVIGDQASFEARPLSPFHHEARACLDALSTSMMSDLEVRSIPDTMAFAWWCRKSNIERNAQSCGDAHLRLGRGLVFHVTPTNVPVNFAFSWVFSLLAGNANVVRLPNRSFRQVDFLVKHISRILAEDRFAEVSKMNVFVQYGHEERINAAFSIMADARILWGGDATINTFREFPQSPRCIDICFADRYSLCVLGAESVLGLEDTKFNRLVVRFFNDAFLMDQQACSSPRMLVWFGDRHTAEQAASRFWKALHGIVVERYDLTTIAAVDKYTQACRDAIELDCVSGTARDDNYIYRILLNDLPAQISHRRCGSGYFYECTLQSLDCLAAVVTNTFQTLTYFGVPHETLRAFVTQNRLTGIDRIVPLGEAMDIGLIWDGYDLIKSLSRICDIH